MTRNCLRIKKISLLFLIFFSLTLSTRLYAYTLKVPYIGANASILYLGNSDKDSAPSPILRTIGAFVPFFYQELSENLSLVIQGELFFWGTYYTFNGTRALPQEVEAPGDTWNWVLATTIDPRIALEYRFNKVITGGIDLGLAFLLRFPIVSNENGIIDWNHITGYFFGAGRFFYPENNIYIIWSVFDYLNLYFGIKSMYPIFHLWDDENLPFYDQFIFSVNLGFLIKI